ncbi:hypothetical protein TH53_14765 [Pedobacter lusitanus]|uniref:Uncharacterized protein n=2 Tax=Pedobacter lusitanus TaxID=1503925 RepID=A0A0D0GGR4_9SPHI|nr:hypothetical protein TH53_14765 [Pedobacter lusitanus]
MLGALSYLNLIFAVLYFLAYLLNGNRLVVLGLLIVIVFNWMALRNLEIRQRQWSAFQWLAALITILYAFYMGYGAVLLLLDAIRYQYYPAAAILLILSGLIFSFTIILQLFAGLYQKTNKKSD